MTKFKKCLSLLCLFLPLFTLSCVKKSTQQSINSAPEIVSAKPQILRAKELYLKNDYASFVKELVVPAVDRAAGVISYFKMLHSKIERTTWDEPVVKKLLADIVGYESKLTKKTPELVLKVSELANEIQKGLENGQSWDELETQTYRDKILARLTSLKISLAKLKAENRKLANVQNESGLFNGLSTSVVELSRRIQLFNVTKSEINRRLDDSMRALQEFKKIDAPGSSKISEVFEFTLCTFVFSSARLFAKENYKNGIAFNPHFKVDLCQPPGDSSNSLLMKKQAWVFPFWGDLSKEDFIHLSSVPVMLLGLNAQHVTYSDGFPGTQFLFYSHDIAHTEEILGQVFGDFSPSLQPNDLDPSVTISQTLNKVLESVKLFSSNQKTDARENALQEFLTKALTPDLSSTERSLIIDVMFELLHEVQFLNCPRTRYQTFSFPECSYLKTLAKVDAGRPMKPATFFKRYLSDGIDIFAESENEYELIKMLQASIVGTPLEAAGVTSAQVNFARKTLTDLNKRVAGLLEW